MIKFTILLARRKDITQEEFIAYHKNNHAPLFRDLPEVKQYVKRYVQCHISSVVFPDLPPPIFDGVTEIWFNSMEDIAKVFTSESYMKTIRPDEEKFLDMHSCSFLICEENQVI